MTGDSLAMDKLALQKMMHDLKAPLTALKILRTRQTLEAGEDSLLMATLHRLESLLANCVGEVHFAPSALDNARIEHICESLIAEKRLLFSNNFSLNLPSTDRLSLKVAPLDLHKILSNLVHNAGEACRSTGGDVSLTVVPRDGRLEFIVRDEGSGMDALALAALKRGAPLTRRGWGVGLFIVRDLVNKTGGRLEFSSEPGQGTKAKVSWAL